MRCLEVLVGKSFCGVAIGSDVYMYEEGFEEWSGTTQKETRGAVWKVTRNTDGSFEWSTIILHKSKRPSPRSAVCDWEYKETLWIFGGVGCSPVGFLNNHGDFVQRLAVQADPFGYNNQLLCYDPAVESWQNMKCYGEIPTPRAGASAAVIKDKVWLYGGSNGVSVFYKSDELYELNMHSASWTQIKTSIPWPLRMPPPSLAPITGNQLGFT